MCSHDCCVKSRNNFKVFLLTYKALEKQFTGGSPSRERRMLWNRSIALTLLRDKDEDHLEQHQLTFSTTSPLLSFSHSLSEVINTFTLHNTVLALT